MGGKGLFLLADPSAISPIGIGALSETRSPAAQGGIAALLGSYNQLNLHSFANAGLPSGEFGFLQSAVLLSSIMFFLRRK